MARTTETKWIIGVDDNASKKLRKISASFKVLGKQAERTGKSLSRKLTAPIAGVAAGLGLLARKAIISAEEIQKLSIRLGVSTEALSEWQFVAQQAGVENNAMIKSWQKMAKSVSDADKGLVTAKETYDRLGVAVTDVKNLSPDKQFEVLAAALNRVDNETEQLTLSMEIFGSKGAQMLQIIKQGADEMDRQRKFAQRLGIVIDQDMADASAKVIDKFAILKDQIRGIGIAIAKWALPYINQFADRASILIEKVKNLTSEQVEFIAKVAGIAAAIGPMLIIVGKLTLLLPALTKGLDTVKKTMTLLKFATVQAMIPMLAWVALAGAVAVALLAVWANWGDKIQSIFQSALGWITTAYGDALKWLKATGNTILGAIGDAWGWLQETIFSSMKPVLDWLIKAYSKAYGFILEGIGKVIQAFGWLIKQIAKLPGASDVIKELAGSVDDFGKTVEKMGENLDLGEMAKTVIGAIGDAVRGGADAVAAFDWSEAWSSLSAGVGNQTAMVKQQFADMLAGLGLDAGKIKEILAGLGIGGDTSGAATVAGTETPETENGETPEQAILTWKDFMKSQFADVQSFVRSGADQTAQLMADAFAGSADRISAVMGKAVGEVATNMLGLTEGPILIGRAFKKMAIGIIQNLTGVIIKMLIIKALASVLGFSLGPMPSLASIVGGTLAGKATGGPVQQGTSYIVGEKGPEIFTPHNSGTVVPNNRVGVGSVTNHITINAEGNLLNDPLSLRRVTEAINDELNKVQDTYYEPSVA